MNGVTPNKANQRRKEIIQDIGCIVCLKRGIGFSPCTWHHIDGQKSQEKHKLTFGLCPQHHTVGGYGVSLHAGKKAFERLNGTEQELLEYQNSLIEEYDNT